ncbi:MAG: thioredoxin [Ignavibacteriales bacterium]|nr:thioredoxin [Ignavibacteriales bacterium]
MKPIEVTDATFEDEILKSDKPALVDFWAVWCGPCKVIAPVVEEIAADYDGKLVVGKLDVDSNQESAIKYGVRSIPTLLVFKGGEVAATIIGAKPKEQIVKEVEAVL